MICPHCTQDLAIPEEVWEELDNGREKAIVAAQCCGHAVIIRPVCKKPFNTSEVAKYFGFRRTDDFETPFKKTQIII